MPEMDKLIGSPVIPVQTPSTRRNPEITLRIFNDGIYKVVTQALVISESMLINSKSISVIPVQPLPRPKPHEPPAVLQRAYDIAVRKTLNRSEMSERKIRRLGPCIQRQKHQQGVPKMAV